MNLSRSKTVYVFQSGDTALFALTADPTGEILPSQVCGLTGWRRVRSLTLDLGNGKQIDECTTVTLAAIKKHGFYLAHGAIHGTLIDYVARDRDYDMALAASDI